MFVIWKYYIFSKEPGISQKQWLRVIVFNAIALFRTIILAPEWVLQLYMFSYSEKSFLIF
jgi:hypothetical protein